MTDEFKNDGKKVLMIKNTGPRYARLTVTVLSLLSDVSKVVSVRRGRTVCIGPFNIRAFGTSVKFEVSKSHADVKVVSLKGRAHGVLRS